MMKARSKLTHSRKQAFLRCRRQHYYAYELGWRRESNPKALRIGTAGHVGLETLQVTGDIAQAMIAVRRCYEECPDHIDDYEWQIERETVMTLVAGYDWRWSESDVEILATELSFAHRLPRSRTWDVAGKVDGICRVDDRVLVLEHKFLGESIASDADLWDRVRLDSQISTYTSAARRLGYDCSGALYDVIRKPTIRPVLVDFLDDDGQKIIIDGTGARVFDPDGSPRQTASKKCGYAVKKRLMTPAEWSDKLLADIAQRPEYYYQRVEVPRLTADLANHDNEFRRVASDISSARKSNSHYRHVDRHCSHCAFSGLCEQDLPSTDALPPDGFIALEDVHPELSL